MTTYTNSKELNGKCLKHGDRVVFKYQEEKITYLVYDTYLDSVTSHNAIIFDRLEIDRLPFATKYYGYPVDCGNWPYFQQKDFEAVTRLVLALFDKVATPKELDEYGNIW